ncbi:MAG TPA: protein kinase, partial [Pyrinomonadaceae bacterium]|nr:protein kinase [Pyrinomonadaceae bacterium]
MRETDPRNAATQIDLPRSTDEGYVPGPDPRVGLILDSKYKLLESLGQGGMGSIFRAQRLHIGDEVAVKLLHHDLVREKQALERFRREARAAAMIRHPNVVSIHDFNDGTSEATEPY